MAPSLVREIRLNRFEASDLSSGPRHKLSRSSLKHTKQSVWRGVNRENDKMLRAAVTGFDLREQLQPELGSAAPPGARWEGLTWVQSDRSEGEMRRV